MISIVHISKRTACVKVLEKGIALIDGLAVLFSELRKRIPAGLPFLFGDLQLVID